MTIKVKHQPNSQFIPVNGRIKLPSANAQGIRQTVKDHVTAHKVRDGYIVITSYGRFKVKTLKEVKQF